MPIWKIFYFTQSTQFVRINSYECASVMINLIYRGKTTFNSLWLSDAIWRHATRSALVWTIHYNDVIMGTIASQITSLTIVFSTIYSDADQNIKVSRHWPLCGNSPGTGEFPTQMAINTENFSISWRHHDLNQCWLTITEVQWQSHRGNFTRDPSAKINLKIPFRSPRRQWFYLPRTLHSSYLHYTLNIPPDFKPPYNITLMGPSSLVFLPTIGRRSFVHALSSHCPIFSSSHKISK